MGRLLGKFIDGNVANGEHRNPVDAERGVLERGVTAVFGVLTWKTHGFAVATGYDAATPATT